MMGEVTPLYLGADVVTGEVPKILTGLIEHHISADVAYAVEQYYLVTGDQQIIWIAVDMRSSLIRHFSGQAECSTMRN